MMALLVGSLGICVSVLLLIAIPAELTGNIDNFVRTFEQSIPETKSVKSEDAHQHGSEKCVMSLADRQFDTPCERLDLPPSSLPKDATVLEADEYPFDERLWPELGNGHLATVVKGDAMFMNGLYNGGDVTSHRARIPSPVAVTVTNISPGNVTYKYVLDMARGFYYERYEGDGFYVELRMYAHRVAIKSFVVEVVIADTSRGGRRGDIRVDLAVHNGTDSEDITWTDVDDNGQITLKTGHTNTAEYAKIAPVTPVTIMSSNIPSNITLPPSLSKADTFFVTSISTDRSEAIESWNQVMAMLPNGTVLSSHVAEWSGLWERGRIDMTGNLTLARINYACLYYLSSSLPLHPDPRWPFIGLSPGGLAHGRRGQDYNGHVFWDQDTWMFPPIMMLHSDLGRTIIGTRIRTLEAGKILANKTGYLGVRYPWESAFTGLETSPSKTCGDQEQHITGDVSLAFRQYLQLTNDTTFLIKERGLEALSGMAEFWASRVMLNTSTELYEIKGVMPPDEYHDNVNNSVYTNTVAAISLYTAIYASKMAGKTPPKHWEDIADNMYIPFDEKLQYHPEYDGYKMGTVVKQADVVMLAFPLMSLSSNRIGQENDLFEYQKVTPGGPAMTWGIFTINWLAIGHKDKADPLFYRTALNVRKPFYIWTENADGSGAVNFHTGMGGYLQAVLFGYGGFRIQSDELTFDPQLPPSVTNVKFTGIDYGTNSFDLSYDIVNMTITATKLNEPMLIRVGRKDTSKFTLNEPKTFPTQQAAVFIFITPK